VKHSAEPFATVVRGLPLTPGQATAADEVLAACPTEQVPGELIRREVLTAYQARMILAGRAAELTIGRYALLDELGGGGMGQVFKARDTAMDRLVALKVIRPDLLAGPSAVLRFQQEVKAAARLAHPNIVRAYDAGTSDGRHYLVTELVVGSDLGRELARRGALPPGEACEFARQAALGLQHAYEHGLTHRDVKPSNLLLSAADRVVKVTDFGLARLGDAGGGLTAAGSVFGTPDYIAPEQASSATAADIRSDVYSLGCTLYHFMTGEVPFPGDTAMAKLVAHATQEPLSLDDSCPGVNPALAAVVRRMMAKNPADRYATPRDAADALTPFCPRPRAGATLFGPQPSSSVPVLLSAPPASATAQLNSAVTAPSLPPTVPPAAVGGGTAAGRGPLLAAVAVLSVVVVALGAAVAMLLSRPAAPTAPTPEPAAKAAPATNGPAAEPPVTRLDRPVTFSLDWPRAKEAGVTVYLNDKPLAAGEAAKPLTLPPGRYTLLARRDGIDLEARTFEVTPDDAGKPVATRPAVLPDPAADPGEVRRWGAAGAVTDVAYLPDGQSFVTAEVPGGNPYPGPDSITPTAGAMYAVEGRQVSARWKTLYGHRVAVLPRVNRAVALSFFETPPGFIRLESGLNDDLFSFRVIDYQAGQVQKDVKSPLKGWRTRIPLLVASRDGSRVLFTTTGPEPDLKPSGEVRVHAVRTTAAGAFEFPEAIRFPGDTACFDPTGPRVLTARDKVLVLHDEETGKPLSDRYTGPQSDVTCVAMSEDGKKLAAGDASGAVSVWAVGAKERGAVGKGHPSRVNAVAFTLDGARVVSAGEDGTVRVWDAGSGKEVRQYKHDGGKPVYALAVSPGGKRVLTGGADKTIRLWQLP
jgi:hypothetical protein